MDGTLDAATARELVGEALTTWSVSQDGNREQLGFADGDGHLRRIDLPVEAVSGLLLTLPRVLQRALEACGDDRDRIVHPLREGRLEQAGGNGLLILSLDTTGGFGASFTLAPGELAATAQAGQEHVPALAPAARVLN